MEENTNGYRGIQPCNRFEGRRTFHRNYLVIFEIFLIVLLYGLVNFYLIPAIFPGSDFPGIIPGTDAETYVRGAMYHISSKTPLLEIITTEFRYTDVGWLFSLAGRILSNLELPIALISWPVLLAHIATYIFLSRKLKLVPGTRARNLLLLVFLINPMLVYFYTQPFKDTFVLLGWALVAYGLKDILNNDSKAGILNGLGQTMIGLAIFFLCKRYIITLLAISLPFSIIFLFIFGSVGKYAKFCFSILMTVLIVLLLVGQHSNDRGILMTGFPSNPDISTEQDAIVSSCPPAAEIGILDHYTCRINSIRRGFMTGGSVIDTRFYKGYEEVIGDVPKLLDRLIFNGYFSTDSLRPKSELGKASAKLYLVDRFLTSAIALSAVFYLFTAVSKEELLKISPIIFISVFIGMVICMLVVNYGALIRLKYPFLFVPCIMIIFEQVGKRRP